MREELGLRAVEPLVPFVADRELADLERARRLDRIERGGDDGQAAPLVQLVQKALQAVRSQRPRCRGLPA
jgi:hypothetical protein